MRYTFLTVLSLALIAGVMASPLLAKDYFVAQGAANASDENPGTEAAPWKTIGRSLKSIATGDTVRIGSGVYREQIVLPGEAWTIGGVEYPKVPAGTGFGELVSFVGESRDKVIIKGSDIVTDWAVHKDAIWVRNDWSYNSQQVFCDGKPLTQIAGTMVKYLQEGISNTAGDRVDPKWLGRKGDSLKDIEAGSFYVDLEAKKLYIWLADGSDPSKHVIEAGVRPFGIGLHKTQYIRVANLSIQQVNASATGNWGGLLATGDGFIIDNVDSSWNDVSGLQITGRHHIISNSTFDHNGNCGITGSAVDGASIINCQTNYNNRRHWWADWHAGGIKFASYVQNVMVSGHTAAYNEGHSVWFDSKCSHITIENARIHNNEGMGIFYEVSQRGLIKNNVVYDNKGRGIYISSSSNCLISHNLCFGNGMSAIVLSGVVRKTWPLFGHPDTKNYYCENNYIYGNILMDNCNPALAPSAKDREGRNRSARPELILPDPGMVTNHNNRSDYNVFYRTGDRVMPFWAGWGKGTEVVQVQSLDAWQKATGHDAHSVIAEPLFVNLEKRDFHPLTSSPIFLTPAIPGNRNDAEGRDFYIPASATAGGAQATPATGPTTTMSSVAAGPYAGE